MKLLMTFYLFRKISILNALRFDLHAEEQSGKGVEMG